MAAQALALMMPVPTGGGSSSTNISQKSGPDESQRRTASFGSGCANSDSLSSIAFKQLRSRSIQDDRARALERCAAGDHALDHSGEHFVLFVACL